jgi:hypothetical protein
LEHVPVDGLQVPATWQASLAVQVTGLAPLHTALWQVSVWVHALPSLQAVPFDFGEQIPTKPGKLQAEHWSVHAVLQQTPLTQLFDAH